MASSITLEVRSNFLCWEWCVAFEQTYQCMCQAGGGHNNKVKVYYVRAGEIISVIEIMCYTRVNVSFDIGELTHLSMIVSLDSIYFCQCMCQETMNILVNSSVSVCVKGQRTSLSVYVSKYSKHLCQCMCQGKVNTSISVCVKGK